MIVSTNGEETTLSKKCTTSGKVYSLTLETIKYKQWERGSYVQDVWPNLTKEEREFILTGTTPQEWSNMFHLEEEDEL
jgi:hypothetical protein